MKRRLSENLKRVQARIHDACARCGRDASRVTLVAVTKTATLEVVRTMVELGVTDVGENRVQELSKRAGAVNEWLMRRARGAEVTVKARPRWHMIGHVQRNKVKHMLPWVDLIHSVDSLRGLKVCTRIRSTRPSRFRATRP